MKRSTVMFVFVALAFVALGSAWTTLFILANHQHIREVPIATELHEPRRGQ